MKEVSSPKPMSNSGKSRIDNSKKEYDNCELYLIDTDFIDKDIPKNII